MGSNDKRADHHGQVIFLGVASGNFGVLNSALHYGGPLGGHHRWPALHSWSLKYCNAVWIAPGLFLDHGADALPNLTLST